MKTIKILKNGQAIKQFFVPAKLFQKYFALAFDLAGSMYNGVDEFSVIID